MFKHYGEMILKFQLFSFKTDRIRAFIAQIVANIILNRFFYHLKNQHIF